MNMPVKSNLLPFSLITISILLLSSCRAPKELEYRDFKNLSVSNVGVVSSTLKMDLEYYNPNNFGLQLKSTELDIYIDGNYLGHTVQDVGVSIPRRAVFDLPVSVAVDMKNIFKNIFTGLFKTEVLVKIVGHVKLGKANVYMSMPVSYEGKQTFSVF